MKIYVAHTYGRRHGLSEQECELNAFKSIEVGRKLILKGHNPFVPNLWHFIHTGWSQSPDEDVWLSLVSEWIYSCDALFVANAPSWDDSGVHREVEMAKRMGMPIYYNIDDIEVKNGL